jgi:hypothetical protein
MISYGVILLNVFKRAYGAYNINKSTVKGTRFLKQTELENIIFLLKRDHSKANSKLNQVGQSQTKNSKNTLNFVNPIK